MELNVGDIVAIRHYSTVNPFTTVILKIEDNFITIKLTKDFAMNSLFEGEPLVIGYSSENKVFLLSCDIETIDIVNSTAVLKPDNDETFVNLRRHERFPISLYADVLTLDSRKKHVVIIKDLSQYGMLIYSKSDFQLNEFVEINVFTEKDVVFIKGSIMRKIEGPNYKKYGLMITYQNLKSINLIEGYLKRLKFSYEQQIRKMKTEF